MGQELYREIQKITQKWIWGSLMAVTVLLALIMRSDYLDRMGNANDEPVFISEYFILLVPFIVFFVLKSFSMETSITTKGVYIKTYPLGLISKFYSWSDVEAARLDEYWHTDNNLIDLDVPIMGVHEYARKGVFSMILKQSVYTVKGRQALKLRMKSGADVYIGTQRPEEIKKVLKILIASGMGEEYILGIKFFENKT